jgi:thymidylate kinase
MSMPVATSNRLSPHKPSGLHLIRDLCLELNRAGIDYCHWKSNNKLDRSATGDSDLDLLVSRADVRHFSEILYGLGFKLVQKPSYLAMPGVLDYYGYDRESDRLIHVHAHYQLILGHDASKNYHLPVEQQYLETSTQGDLFRVPQVDFEFIIFVIRMVLKHCGWDAILLGQKKLTAGEGQELEFLRSRVNERRVKKLLVECLPYIDETLFADCLTALSVGTSTFKCMQAAEELQSRLKPCARRPRLFVIWTKVWNRFSISLQAKIFHRLPQKSFSSGGLLIAVVGGDGAGKTTVVSDLNSWLSKDFKTMKVHMGKPSWSLTTIAVRSLIKIGRLFGLYPFMRAEIQYTHDRDALKFPGYPWMLRQVCTARDRYLTYLKARRFTTNGGVVICDRYPLVQIEFMDSPQVERMTANYPTNRFIRSMISLEHHYYQLIMPPDLLIVLKTDPEVAVKRKVDEKEVSIRPRSTEIWEVDWYKSRAYIIDGGRSRTEVIAEAKALVWSQL